jgi:hypothetical protein
MSLNPEQARNRSGTNPRCVKPKAPGIQKIKLFNNKKSKNQKRPDPESGLASPKQKSLKLKNQMGHSKSLI